MRSTRNDASQFAAVGVDTGPNNSMFDSASQTPQTAVRARGMQIQVLNASTSREIDDAFATFLHQRPDALFVSGDGLFTSRRVQLVLLAMLHKVPAIFANREFA